MPAATQRLGSIELLFLLCVCVFTGIGMLAMPVVAIVVLAFLCVLAILIQFPRPQYVLFAAFLVVQDPLRLVLRGDETDLGFVVKRIDEPLLFLLGGWVLFRSVRARRALGMRGIGWTILACFAAMILSSFVAGVQLQPALMGLLLFSKPFLLFAIGASLDLRPQEIRAGLRPSLYLMLTVVLFALVFMAFPDLQDSYIGEIRNPDLRVGIVSAQGFFDGPGPYSWYCAATFAIAYAAYLTFGQRFYLYSSGLAGLFTLLAWRRKSILGIVAMLIVATLIQSGPNARGQRRALAIAALVGLMAATLLAPYLYGLWEYTVKEYGTNPYSNPRAVLHYTSVLIAIDFFPLGSGLGSFASHASRVYYSDIYYRYDLAKIWGLSPGFTGFVTDTFWPMVLGEGGFIGLLAYGLFFWLLVKHLWYNVKRSDLLPEHHFLVLAGFFLLLGSLSESTSSQIYDSTMQSALVMIPVGICWATFVSKPPPPTRQVEEKRAGSEKKVGASSIAK
jgi:hypothetical protein